MLTSSLLGDSVAGAGEFGAGRSRTKRCQGYSGVAELLGKRLGKTEHVRLGGVVHSHQRSRLERRRRSEIQDPTRFRFDHRRQE